MPTRRRCARSARAPERAGARMSDAANRLAHSRLAIVEHIARRERRHDPREEPAPPAYGGEPPPREEPPPPGTGWMGRVQHAVRMWWRYHPAQMAVEVATPVL